MADNKINAVYYPYCLMPEWMIKHVLLYFDTVTVCLPAYFKLPEYEYLCENSLLNIYTNPFVNKLYSEDQLAMRSLEFPHQRTLEQELKKEVDQQYQQQIQSAFERPLDEEWSRLYFTEAILRNESLLDKNFLIRERVSIHFNIFSNSYSEGQIPFTSNPTAQKAFLEVFNSIAEKNENIAVLNELIDQKAGFLAKEIMKNHLLPLPGYDTKSYEDILELKDRLKDDLEAFKIELRKLVWDIKSNPWDDYFERDVISVIDTKINPTINELEKRKNKDSFLAKLLKHGGPTASLIMGLNAFPNIPTDLLLGIVALGMGAPILGKWVETKKEKQSEYNGLNFIVEVKKELS